MRLLLEKRMNIVRHVFPDGAVVIPDEDCVFTPQFIVTDLNTYTAKIIDTDVPVPPDIKARKYLYDDKAKQFVRLS